MRLCFESFGSGIDIRSESDSLISVSLDLSGWNRSRAQAESKLETCEWSVSLVT